MANKFKLKPKEKRNSLILAAVFGLIFSKSGWIGIIAGILIGWSLGYSYYYNFHRKKR